MLERVTVLALPLEGVDIVLGPFNREAIFIDRRRKGRVPLPLSELLQRDLQHVANVVSIEGGFHCHLPALTVSRTLYSIT